MKYSSYLFICSIHEKYVHIYLNNIYIPKQYCYKVTIFLKTGVLKGLVLGVFIYLVVTLTEWLSPLCECLDISLKRHTVSVSFSAL